MNKMAEANGKIILFGEHFVVHGAPAIAAGISSKVVVEVKKADKNSIVTEHQVSEKMSEDGIQRVLAVMGIHDKYEVHLKGDLKTYGGLGSSAAFCVALVKALAEEKGMDLTKEEINKFAYEGEKAFHGDPSGIDNTVACYGGIVQFKKTPEKNNFEFFKVGKDLDVVISFTGKYSPTAKMVERVRKFKEQDETEFAQLMDEYSDIEHEGRKFLAKGKLRMIGTLMNANQSLLSEVGVSDETNDRIIKIMLENGALGAKLTGGGGGGCCIALAKDENAAKGIAGKLVEAGFDSFTAKITR
jgi:mevalonate kinase